MEDIQNRKGTTDVNIDKVGTRKKAHKKQGKFIDDEMHTLILR